MDDNRLEYVTNRMANALKRELISWNKVEQLADRFTEMAPKFEPINLHKDINFEFKQMYDAEKAAYIQDEISDLLNAERYK